MTKNLSYCSQDVRKVFANYQSISSHFIAIHFEVCAAAEDCKNQWNPLFWMFRFFQSHRCWHY